MVNESAARAEARRPKEVPEILTKPLPQILDEMEASIKLTEEAARDAREAAEEARKAAEEAREAAKGPLSPTTMMAIIVVSALAAVVAAVAISVGISAMG